MQLSLSLDLFACLETCAGRQRWLAMRTRRVEESQGKVGGQRRHELPAQELGGRPRWSERSHCAEEQRRTETMGLLLRERIAPAGDSVPRVSASRRGTERRCGESGSEALRAAGLAFSAQHPGSMSPKGDIESQVSMTAEQPGMRCALAILAVDHCEPSEADPLAKQAPCDVASKACHACDPCSGTVHLAGVGPSVQPGLATKAWEEQSCVPPAVESPFIPTS